MEQAERQPVRDLKKVGYLYRLTSPSGKFYFGITVDCKKRWAEHRIAANSGCPGALYNAVRKYGFDSFKKEVMVVSDYEHVKLLEVRAIEIYNTFAPHGYNLTKGGDGTLGVVITEERRLKTSLSNLGKVRSEQTRKNVSDALKGRKLPEEVKRKIGEASAKVERTVEWKDNISKAKKGVAQTPEAKKAHSESQRLKWQDPEYRALQLEKQRVGLERKRQIKQDPA